METFVSAVVGDLVSRIISSMIKKCREPRSVGEKLERLQQVLQRIYTIVEEAQGRNITNEGMLLQLKMLMEGMYRGYFVLDTFKYQAFVDEKAKKEVSHSFALSNFNPAKRQCFTTSTTMSMVFGSEAINELKIVLENLENIIADVQEFVILLGSFPRMFRQPYSTYLFVDNCMFGRQIERERIINFLLQKEAPSTQNLSVLPIIGRRGVGKRTLVEHACNDERVRNYYSLIVRFSGDDLKNKMLTILEEDGVIKHQKFAPGRSLLIIELDCDVDKVAWRRFYSSVSYMASGSKIIITGITDKITSFGTTHPLTLKYLPTEEYWYFFKVLAFGCADPEEYPKLASLAMEVATELRGSFMYANMYGGLLRANFNAQFWCCILASLRKHMQKNLFLFDEHPMDLIGKNHPSYLHQMGRDAQVYLLYNYYSIGSACIELPKVTVQDLITGNNVPVEEKFEVLGWKSLIPPYYCYIASCAKQKPQRVVTKKKHDRWKS